MRPGGRNIPISSPCQLSESCANTFPLPQQRSPEVITLATRCVGLQQIPVPEFLLPAIPRSSAPAPALRHLLLTYIPSHLHLPPLLPPPYIAVIVEMDEFSVFSAFLETEEALRNGLTVEGPPAIGSSVPEGVPVDMEYIHNSSSYSWCVVA